MIIVVGSRNLVKVQAVQDLISDYPHLENAKIRSIDAPSGVHKQPKTAAETTWGAINRAKAAFGSCKDCAYGIGLESGLMEIPHPLSGVFDVCVCIIYDGKNLYPGLSSAWSPPQKVVDLMRQGLDMNDAAFRAGLTDNPRVGSKEGLIGIVTSGRLDRKAYTQESLRAALIHLEP